jgi:hypothetical protein
VFFFDEGSYRVTRSKRAWHCDCPAGYQGHTCRHIEMVSIFTEAEKVNKGLLYDFDRKRWVEEVHI